jgi:hypothetical protein
MGALCATVLLSAACNSEENGTGSASIAASIKSATPTQVQSVRVTITAPDIAVPIVNELAKEGPESWRGTVQAIPAGPNRAFAAQALGLAGEVLYQGSAQAGVVTDQTVVVMLLLQPAVPPDPFVNTSPYFTALVASTGRTVPGGRVDLLAAATDPDGDPLTYTWSATGGSYDGTATGASAIWTAPPTEGSYTLTVEVADGRGGRGTSALTIHAVSVTNRDASSPDEGPGCECKGTGPGGVSVVAACGQSACGADFFTYLCGASGWSWTGQACTENDDAGAGSDASTCECQGKGPGDVLVTAACGQSACGSDRTLYECGASGWSWTGQACTGTCECQGMGPGDAPVTAACGQSACGSDYSLYECSASGWSWTGQACTGTCECQGVGPDGVVVTAACGHSACGSDFTLYECSASGWSGTGQACTCECHGTGPGDVPVTAFCGQSTCGSDYSLYACSASGWSGTGQACTGTGDAGAPCECHGTGPGGIPVVAACGQSACGSDLLTYLCAGGNWSLTGPACGTDAGFP